MAEEVKPPEVMPAVSEVEPLPEEVKPPEVMPAVCEVNPLPEVKPSEVKPAVCEVKPKPCEVEPSQVKLAVCEVNPKPEVKPSQVKAADVSEVNSLPEVKPSQVKAAVSQVDPLPEVKPSQVKAAVSEVNPVPVKPSQIKAAVCEVNPLPEDVNAAPEAVPNATQLQRLHGKSQLDVGETPERSSAQVLDNLDTPDAKDPAKGACYKAGLRIANMRKSSKRLYLHAVTVTAPSFEALTPEDRRPLLAEAPKPNAKVKFAVDAQLAVLEQNLDLQGVLLGQKNLRASAKMGEEPGYSKEDADQQPTEEEEAAALKRQMKGCGRGRDRGKAGGKGARGRGRGRKGAGGKGVELESETPRPFVGKEIWMHVHVLTCVDREYKCCCPCEVARQA